MAKKLYLCRVEHEFVVAAESRAKARNIAQDSVMEEQESETMSAAVVCEITTTDDLGQFRSEVPYGEDARTCLEILAAGGDKE